MGGKQLGHRFAEGFAYGDYVQSTAKKRAKRERFLAEMEAVLPYVKRHPRLVLRRHENWPFDVTTVTQPVYFWQGTDDKLVPEPINMMVADKPTGAIWPP